MEDNLVRYCILTSFYVIRFKDGSEEFGLVSRQCDVTDPSGEPVIKCDIFSDERRTECNKVNRI